MKKASVNDIKLLRKLKRRKYRDAEKLFVAEGERTVSQILENNFVDVLKVFIEEDQHFEVPPDIPVASMTEDNFEEVSDTETPQGVLALCKIPEEAEITALPDEKAIIVATDGIQDPGNLGTIIRTAAWFGIRALIAGKGTVDVYHPKVIRSTAGATGSIPVISGELQQLLPELVEQGWKVMLLDAGSNSVSLTDFKRPEKIILVVGNEANGIDSELLANYKSLRIDSASSNAPVESLNAAIATGIALHALARIQK